ncbi:MAG: 4Fe-4S binding protein [Clostridia bacterium]|nr:4Fe-4S binding protein [Clostridia bacterium]
MKRIFTVKGGCVLCLNCVYQCPVRAISIIEDVSVVIDAGKCLGCGSCVEVCQMEAIIEKKEKE